MFGMYKDQGLNIKKGKERGRKGSRQERRIDRHERRKVGKEEKREGKTEGLYPLPEDENVFS